jgi:hypothetical protein
MMNDDPMMLASGLGFTPFIIHHSAFIIAFSLGVDARSTRDLDPLGDLGLVERVVGLGGIANGVGALA